MEGANWKLLISMLTLPALYARMALNLRLVDLPQSLVVVIGAAGIFVYAAPGENAIVGPVVVVAGTLAVGGAVILFRDASRPGNVTI